MKRKRDFKDTSLKTLLLWADAPDINKNERERITFEIEQRRKELQQ